MIANIFRTHFNQKGPELLTIHSTAFCKAFAERAAASPKPVPRRAPSGPHLGGAFLLSQLALLQSVPPAALPIASTLPAAQTSEDRAISCECFKIFILCPVADSFRSTNKV